jgi:hypothetical protein
MRETWPDMTDGGVQVRNLVSFSRNMLPTFFLGMCLHSLFLVLLYWLGRKKLRWGYYFLIESGTGDNPRHVTFPCRWGAAFPAGRRVN